MLYAHRSSVSRPAQGLQQTPRSAHSGSRLWEGRTLCVVTGTRHTLAQAKNFSENFDVSPSYGRLLMNHLYVYLYC